LGFRDRSRLEAALYGMEIRMHRWNVIATALPPIAGFFVTMSRLVVSQQFERAKS
jgi:hypothetical protein